MWLLIYNRLSGLERVASPGFRERLVQWLRKPDFSNPSQLFLNMAEQAFVDFFGPSQISFRCLFGSAVWTIIALASTSLIIAARNHITLVEVRDFYFNPRPLIAPNYGLGFALVILETRQQSFFALLTTCFFVDFLSVWELRLILKAAVVRRANIVFLVLFSFLDIVVKIFVSFTLSSYISGMITLYDFNYLDAPALSRQFFLLPIKLVTSGLFTNVYLKFALGIWGEYFAFFSVTLTSLWLLFHLIGIFTSRQMKKLIAIVGVFSFVLDAEKHPFKVVAAATATIVTAAYVFALLA